MESEAVSVIEEVIEEVGTLKDSLNATVSSDEEITQLPSAPTMSKNQMKRLRREQKRQETKATWRKLQKDKRKLKELAKRQEYEEKGKIITILLLEI